MKTLLSSLSIFALLSGSLSGIDFTNDSNVNSHFAFDNMLKINADRASQLEETRYSLSNFIPLNLFVKANAVLHYKITINNNNSLLSQLPDPIIAIGVWGNFKKSLNITGYSIIKLNYNYLNGTIVTPQLGLVFATYYLNNNASIEVTPIDSSDIYSLNEFEINSDTSNNFVNTILSESLDDPDNLNYFFTILKSKNTYEILRTKYLQDQYTDNYNLKRIDLNLPLSWLDKIYNKTIQELGLNINYQGIAHHFNYKWFMWETESDTVYNTNGATVFSGNILSKLILNPTFLNNELSDTWRVFLSTFGGIMSNRNFYLDWWNNVISEVYNYLTTLNLFKNPGRILQWNKFHNNGPLSKEILKNVELYFWAVKNKHADINNINNSVVKLFLNQNQADAVGITFWVQLIDTFGNQFLPILNQYYRTDIIHLEEINLVRTEALALSISKITKQNLINFFTTWGFPLSDKTKAIMNSFGQDDSSQMLKNAVFTTYDKHYIDDLGVNNLGNYAQKLINFWPTKNSNQTNLVLNNYQTIKNLNLENLITEEFITENRDNLIDNRYVMPSNKLLINGSCLILGGFDDSLDLIINVDMNGNLIMIGNNNIIDKMYNQVYFALQIKNKSGDIVEQFMFNGIDNVLDVLNDQNFKLKINEGWQINLFASETQRIIYAVGDCNNINSYHSLDTKIKNTKRAQIDFIYKKGQLLINNFIPFENNDYPDWIFNNFS